MFSICLALSLTACNQAAAVPNQDQVAEQASKPAEPVAESAGSAQSLFDYASLTDAVLIRLDQEPLIASPIQTLVTTAPQRYTLYFRDPMDRKSVGASILTNAQAFLKDEASAFVPIFSFQWVNDQELKLTAEKPANVKLPERSPKTDLDEYRKYVISTDNAKTKSGSTLRATPAFSAVLYEHEQLWAISVENGQRVKLSSFEQPYFPITWTNPSSNVLLLERPREYCECDSPTEPLYALYELDTKTVTTYPVKLMTSYRGKGDFVADKRGFFYEKQPEQTGVPSSPTAISVKLDDYVFGAGFSRNQTYLLLVVGKEGQPRDFDLIVRDLATGKDTRISKKLSGFVPKSELLLLQLANHEAGHGQSPICRHAPQLCRLKRWSLSSV